MAYTTGNLNLTSQTLEGSTGTKIWTYTGTDSLATVLGAGYISDATKKGMKAGDLVRYDKTDTVSTYILKVASISSGAATLAGTDFAASGNIAIGAATTDTIGFYGTTGVTQPSGAAEAAVTFSIGWLTAIVTNTSGTTFVAFTNTANALAIGNAVGELVRVMTLLGIWKGGA